MTVDIAADTQGLPERLDQVYFQTADEIANDVSGTPITMVAGGVTGALHDIDGNPVVATNMVPGRFYGALISYTRDFYLHELLPLTVLPRGTSMNTDLRWDDADGRWEATSPVTTLHAILVRDLAVATLEAGMLHVLDESLTFYPGSASSGAYADTFAEILALNNSGVQIGPDPRGLLPFAYRRSSRGSFSDNSQSSQISNVWRPGDPLPYLVVFSPTAHGLGVGVLRNVRGDYRP